ncbi:MAG: helix-turn-helix domain-containing protein [Beduini sp.]|uniref:helix-turn-helix domain-containing protein n=1 Tax=Beduini sp. TaxID=1922300 RepID=UPI0011C750FF
MKIFNKKERLLIILKRKEAGLTVGQLADELLMSKSNLSRIENGKIMVSDENREIIEKYFSINLSSNEESYQIMERRFREISESMIFYKLFNNYSLDDIETDSVYNIGKSISYPLFILLKLHIYCAKNISRKFNDKYIPIFNSVVYLMEPYYQKVFYIAKMNYFYFCKNFKKSLAICDYVENSFPKDDLLDSFILHFKAGILGCLGATEKVISTLDKAIKVAERTDNKIRLMALHLTKANSFRLQGDYEKSLNYDFQNLQYGNEVDIHIYDYILLRNIAWTYYLMGDYENAIKRYKIAEELDIDDDLCFIMAYCYFKLAMDCESPSQKLNLRIQCKEYLNKGRKAKNSGIAFPYLIDWLELMLNKKYSVKAEQKLLYCLKKYETTMHVDSRNNIYKFLIEHYEYHQDSKNADYYRKKLQNG